MSSQHFPSLDVTYHILTAMEDPKIRNLRKRKELRDRRLYPRGFPCDQLISAGLSPRSAGYQTPKQAYAKIVNKWNRKRDTKRKKAAMKNFDDGDNDDDGSGTPGPPRGSDPSRGCPGSNGGGGSKRNGSSNPFSALGTVDEESQSDDVGTLKETNTVNIRLQYTSQMRTESILAPPLQFWVSMFGSQLLKDLSTQPPKDENNNHQWWETAPTFLISG